MGWKLKIYLVVLICLMGALVADEKTIVKKEKVEIKEGRATLICVGDTSIAAFSKGGELTSPDNETGTNAGLSERLKIKKFENQPLLKFDFSSIPEGATLTEAFLEIHMLENKPLTHIGVCTIHVDWNEGEGKWNDEGTPDINHTGACFVGPKGVKTKWSEAPGAYFNHVVAGNGGNATSVSKAEHLGEGKYKISVPVNVVMAAIENGQSFLITDETGIFDGPLSNGFICSREVKGKEPTLSITWQKGRDLVAPAFKGKIETLVGPYEGSIIIRFPEAGDDGVEGTAIGYRLFLDGKEISRILVPRPSRKLRVSLLKDLPVGKEIDVKLIAFDEAGNEATQEAKGKTCEKFTGVLADQLKINHGALVESTTNAIFRAKLLDGETLFDPITGNYSPKQQRASSKGFLPVEKSIFPAVRGEIIGAQIQVGLLGDAKELKDIEIKSSVLKGVNGEIPAANIEFFREHFVSVKDVWIADILPAIASNEKLSIPSQGNIPDQKFLMVYMDVIIPPATKAGVYQGLVTVSSGANISTLPFVVDVRDLVMPDELSFIVEMNAYGHTDNLNIFHETYRLCHKNRLSFNPLGYGHTRPGTTTTPKLNNADKAEDLKIVDWSAYDSYYGPILSGEITKDLPRKGVPATHFYLPFHDAWPYALQKSVPKLFEGRVALGAKPDKDKKEKYLQWVNYLAVNDLMIADHFNQEWRKALEVVAAQFREHFKAKGWTKTKMQIFNNHKYYFPNGSQSLWTMDEPQYGRDYHALNYMYKMQDEALSKEGINTQIRTDVSRPASMGDKMDDTRSVDKTEGLYVVSSAISSERHLLEDILATSKAAVWWYGGGTGAETDPLAVNALFLSRWSMGASGGMPVYMVEGGSNKWTDTDSLRVIRYHEETKMPVCSFRMKAYRRGQQDIELYNMLAKKPGFNRQHINKLFDKEISLKQVTISKGPEDPGYTTFEGLDVVSFDRIREKVIATLLK
jgi:hypothetical protein